MGSTVIHIVKDATDASKRVAFLRGAGFFVTGVGPTDLIRVTGDATSELDWDSGDKADWYIVIGTHDPRADWLSPLP